VAVRLDSAQRLGVWFCNVDIKNKIITAIVLTVLAGIATTCSLGLAAIAIVPFARRAIKETKNEAKRIESLNEAKRIESFNAILRDSTIQTGNKFDQNINGFLEKLQNKGLSIQQAVQAIVMVITRKKDFLSKFLPYFGLEAVVAECLSFRSQIETEFPYRGRESDDDGSRYSAQLQFDLLNHPLFAANSQKVTGFYHRHSQFFDGYVRLKEKLKSEPSDRMLRLLSTACQNSQSPIDGQTIARIAAVENIFLNLSCWTLKLFT